jgi:CxxC motif-containing protein (DUF1111 family)
VGDPSALELGYDPGEELPGGEATNTLLFGQHAFSRHAENIEPDHERWFFAGNGFFKDPWVTAPASTTTRDGLGPLFNARSCAACHFQDGRGSPPLEGVAGSGVGLLYRISVGYDEEERPILDPAYGGQLQPFAISGVDPEGEVELTYERESFTYPDGRVVLLQRARPRLLRLAYGSLSSGAVVSPRTAPAMHGLGLLEAISDERLLELADADDANSDGISGRVRRLPKRFEGDRTLGRFGWKSETRSLREQSAGAFLGDMGLTTEENPKQECTDVEKDCASKPGGGEPEVLPEVLEAIVFYARLLAVPARDRADHPDVLRGKELFLGAGCGDCHVPKQVTGDHELAELSDQVIYPYSDLLLHDMGAGLQDGRGAHRLDREWRTPPLWGLRFIEAVSGHTRLLHDGRARGVEEAILWHGGEAEASRNAYSKLASSERQLLIDFVLSL